ncbi:MAG: lysophospholipid acyltransferase family protein [Candidatus Korobacteraceae bacterium]
MTPRSKLHDRLSWMRSIFVLDPLIWSYTAILGTLSLLSSLIDRGGRIQHGFARLWSWLILKTARCPVRVSGMERVPASRTAVYAVNHLSALDIPVIYVHLSFSFRIMAKKELFRYPFMGWHLRRSGQIPIDRESARASMRSLNAAVQALKAGMPLVVFPEGGRSPDGKVQPFMSGAFYVAIKAGVDVVPMALVGTREVLPMNSFHIRPGPVELIIGEPISTAGLNPRDMEQLAQRTQKAVEDLYYARTGLASAGVPAPVNR